MQTLPPLWRIFNPDEAGVSGPIIRGAREFSRAAHRCRRKLAEKCITSVDNAMTLA
jgi:hypothetical protein